MALFLLLTWKCCDLRIDKVQRNKLSLQRLLWPEELPLEPQALVPML